MARAQMIVDLPTTKAIFDGRDQAARDKLIAEYKQMFEVQRDKFGVDQMQFHVTPAASFLRLHSLTQFGDDLTQFRPLVVAVNADQIARSAGTIARGGPAIFGVVPAYNAAGQHIGSFEVGIDFGGVLDSLKADYGMEAAVLISEEPLRRFVSPKVTAPMLNEANRVGKYVKTNSTHWELMQKLVAPGDVAAIVDTERYTREANGKPYGVVLYPIRNLAGDPIGMISVAKDFSSSRAAAGQLAVIQVLLAVFAIVALAGAVLIVVRGLLLEPLAELRRLSAERAAAGDEPL